MNQKKLSARRQQVLNLCRTQPTATSAELGAAIGVTASNARNIVADLCAEGLLSRVPARWKVAPKAPQAAAQDPTPGRGRKAAV